MAPWVTCMRELPDGFSIVTGDSCGWVKLWDLTEYTKEQSDDKDLDSYKWHDSNSMIGYETFLQQYPMEK